MLGPVRRWRDEHARLTVVWIRLRLLARSSLPILLRLLRQVGLLRSQGLLTAILEELRRRLRPLLAQGVDLPVSVSGGFSADPATRPVRFVLVQFIDLRESRPHCLRDPVDRGGALVRRHQAR